MDFRECTELWANRHNAAHRKLDENTYLEFDGEDFYVTLHGHTILRHHPDGSVTYDDCGWQTHTTQDRMNKFGMPGWRVHQERRVWYLGRGWNDISYPFSSGITVFPDGTVTGAGEDPKATLKLQKRVNDYARKYVENLVDGQVEQPGPGDCWYCLMRTEDGKSLGDVTHNQDHLISHLDEEYYVPSLLINAIEQEPTSIAAHDTALAYLYRKPEHIFPGDFIQKDIAKTIAKYLRHGLGLA